MGVQERIDNLSDSVTHNQCGDFEEYKYMVGKLEALRETLAMYEDLEKKFLED